MLSRVANRLYWMSRYIERAENTARLVKVYAQLMLDLPRGVGIRWRQLVEIAGGDELFDRQYRSAGRVQCAQVRGGGRGQPELAAHQPLHGA